MFNSQSLLSKYVLSLAALILLSFLIIKLNQNVTVLTPPVHLIKSLEKSSKVPFDKLLDLSTKFEFLIKPSLACNESTKLLIFVHSKIDHFDSRNEIRSTWGSVSLQTFLNYRLVFLIGLQKNLNASIEQEIKREHKLNDDLVRGNFIDTYRNLTYKHVMGYKWILHNLNYCEQVHFVMKSDDDAFINIFKIIDLLSLRSRFQSDALYEVDEARNYAEIEFSGLTKSTKQLIHRQRSSVVGHKKLMKIVPETNLKFIACSLQPNGTRVKRTGKWRLTHDEYDLDYFPPYCSGIAYLLNMNALRSIYEQVHAIKRKILFIDDLFLTGIVLQDEQTNYSNYPNYDSTDEDLNAHLEKLEYSTRKGNDAFQIVDWSEFYNYRWQKFAQALAQRDNSFNSVYFINDLDRMPNRKRIVLATWKRMIKYYLVT